MTEFRIVEDFLPPQYFLPLKEYMEGNSVPWYFRPRVADASDNSDSYFTHTFYKNSAPNSSDFPILEPILERIDYKALIRVRANLYVAKKEFIEHGRHTDFPYEHQVMILYINTNNGFTRLEDGTKIDSIANRAVFFDASKPHNSTNCTDEPCRINLNISYF